MQTVESRGARIPIIGLGTWELRDRTCARIVEQALRLGYRHLDTAQAYENEQAVGEGLHASGVKRGEVFVTTKVRPASFAPRDLERSTKESLMKLRLTEVDLLLLHWPSTQVPLADTMGALCRMKALGLTRHIGVSNFTVALIDEAVGLATEPLVTNQIECHAYLDSSKVIAACRRHGLAVTAYSPIARGRVTGDELLARIASTHGKTAGQVALRFLVQQDIIVIPRTSKLERLTENFEIFDFALTDAEMTAIRGLAHPNGRIVNVSWAPQWD
jgi:2,5-diketo-D-gluconate reductase B